VSRQQRSPLRAAFASRQQHDERGARAQPGADADVDVEAQDANHVIRPHDVVLEVCPSRRSEEHV